MKLLNLTGNLCFNCEHSPTELLLNLPKQLYQIYQNYKESTQTTIIIKLHWKYYKTILITKSKYSRNKSMAAVKSLEEI